MVRTKTSKKRTIATVRGKKAYRKWLKDHVGDRRGARLAGFSEFIKCVKRMKSKG